jgi:hypothetical protein
MAKLIKEAFAPLTNFFTIRLTGDRMIPIKLSSVTIRDAND